MLTTHPGRYYARYGETSARRSRVFRPNMDTWHVPRVAGTIKERAGTHPCQMPIEVCERLILATSNLGELVLDPFAGTGTTLVAAKRLGRRYLGIDLSEDYAAIAERRLNAETGPLPGMAM